MLPGADKTDQTAASMLVSLAVAIKYKLVVASLLLLLGLLLWFIRAACSSHFHLLSLKGHWLVPRLVPDIEFFKMDEQHFRLAISALQDKLI